ncbi:MAG: hypothetical protein RLZZ127_3301 [Planctomycetota bacterium]
MSDVYPEDAVAATGAARGTVAADLAVHAQAGLIRRDVRTGHPRTHPYLRVRPGT